MDIDLDKPLVLDKGYFQNSGPTAWDQKPNVQLRFEHVGLDFIYIDCSVGDFIQKLKNRLDSMIRYHGSLDINDTQFLAERLYLGEGIMLNLGGVDDLVYLGSHRTHRNFVDKFSL